jgi:peptidoglycan L-alanyl-D-glutamate endopeptidase CwlK
MFVFSRRSESNLVGVHGALVLVVRYALRISTVDFMVLEGLRSRKRQQKLVERGYSTTMHSRHLTGDAVDLAPWVDGRVPWDDWTQFERVATAMKAASKAVVVPIAWGGDWVTFKDGPHFELFRGYRETSEV